jgi:hypothetical protein
LLRKINGKDVQNAASMWKEGKDVIKFHAGINNALLNSTFLKKFK